MSCQHESPQRLVASTNQHLLESLHWLEEDLDTIRSDDLLANSSTFGTTV